MGEGTSRSAYLLHEALVRRGGIAVRWEKIRQTLAQLLVFCRVRREVDQR
jgi:hypothetical protein